MALNLLEQNDRASWLVARLCQEAGVCLHDPETNPIEMHGAMYDRDHGLVVKDAEGKYFRLRVQAEELHPRLCCTDPDCDVLGTV